MPISWTLILILSSHLYLRLPSRLFPSGCSTKPLHVLHLPHMCCVPHLSYSPLSLISLPPINICRRVQIIKLLIILSSPVSCYIIPIFTKFLNPCDKHVYFTQMPTIFFFSFIGIILFEIFHFKHKKNVGIFSNLLSSALQPDTRIIAF